MSDLSPLFAQVSRMHRHLCPRQVLGVRMGLRAGRELAIKLPQADKRLITFVETDGCTADGIGVATGCWVGRRTMFIVDFGKVAATFVDTQTGRSVRILPHRAARSRSIVYAPTVEDEWQRQLSAYQVMPDEELLSVEPVRLKVDLAARISEPGSRTICAVCGEEVNNGREIVFDGRSLCRACAGEAYFIRSDPAADSAQPSANEATRASRMAEHRL